MPKKIFTQELEGTRRRGRPRKRWKEEVERDLQVLGVGRWRELVAGRKTWKDIEEEEEEEEEEEDDDDDKEDEEKKEKSRNSRFIKI